MTEIQNPANHPMKIVRALMTLTGHKYAFCDRMDPMGGRKRWSIKVWGWSVDERQLAKDILKKHGFIIEMGTSHRIWVRDR